MAKSRNRRMRRRKSKRVLGGTGPYATKLQIGTGSSIPESAVNAAMASGLELKDYLYLVGLAAERTRFVGDSEEELARLISEYKSKPI